MSKHVHSFAERHPGKEETIRDSRFLQRDPQRYFRSFRTAFGFPERERTDRPERARKELRHLEQAMLAPFHDQMRV